MVDSFLSARLASLEKRIVAYEEAIDALADPTVTSHSLDTGQTRVQVTRSNVAQYEKALADMLARRSRLKMQIEGGSTVQVRPTF